ncbi:hypothetical protein AALO_G00162610 [Alosa alosa]|uniref:Uncharacterized protein n=1 Tax=Alosa alosa TaxID=278164 RepID=A0AAV6GHA4_9TELE|nr:hypothetical protein AALO_G00162610 [Alosa alosa]
MKVGSSFASPSVFYCTAILTAAHLNALTSHYQAGKRLKHEADSRPAPHSVILLDRSQGRAALSIRFAFARYHVSGAVARPPARALPPADPRAEGPGSGLTVGGLGLQSAAWAAGALGYCL